MFSTQRLTAIGTLCRRPSALLTPLAPLVLLVFLAVSLGLQVRIAITRRVSSGPIVLTDDAAAVTETVAEAPRGRAAVRLTTKQAFGGAAALFGGILLAASMAGGTYAFLNSQVTILSATNVKSGSLALTVQYGTTAAGSTAAIPTTAWTNMLPGDFAGQQITVANTGSSKASVIPSLSNAATAGWDIRVSAGTCPTTILGSTPLSTTSTTSVVTLAAGTSSVLCVQASLPTTAPAVTQNTAPALSILLTANQVAS